MQLNEQKPAEVLALFDELDKLTRAPFKKAKADIDARLAKRYGIKAGELMPWHYHDPFFQDTPRVFDSDLDEPYRKADIEKVCREFYAGIGLPVDPGAGQEQPVREEGQEPACLLHRHRPRGRRARAGQHRAQPPVGLDDVPRAGPRGLQHDGQQHPEEPALSAAERGAHPDHGRRGDDVRAIGQPGGVPGQDGRAGQGRQGVRCGGIAGAALSAPDLLALVPGDAAFREGDVRGSRAGSGRTVVEAGGEVPGA